MIELMIACKRIWDKYNEDEITVYAAHASFFIVIAFFPFLMLLLSLIQLIPTVSKSDLMELLVHIMPDMLDSLMINIVNDLYVKSPGAILSITALTGLWSAARGMMSIERGLNRIYCIHEKRNYILRRFICAGYTLIMMVVCVVSLTLLVFGNTLQNLILQLFPIFGTVTRDVLSFRSLLSMILFLSSFVILYTFVPTKMQNPWHQIPGAAFTSVCWMLFSYAFSLYFSNFSNYSYMYGSLTAIVLLMLWLYFSICIIFIGAEINYFLR